MEASKLVEVLDFQIQLLQEDRERLLAWFTDASGRRLPSLRTASDQLFALSQVEAKMEALQGVRDLLKIPASGV